MKKTIIPPLAKKDPILEKFHFFFIWFVRITLLIALFRALMSENWHVLGVVIFALVLTFLAFIIERRYKVDLPIEFEIFLVLLIYCSIFLGELRGYYSAFWWWDIALHTFTGVIVGLVGFIVLLILSRRKHIVGAPWIIALFSFSLAAAIGGIWEIFEFFMDQIFGLSMQKSGLMDTMGDLIVNNLGALFSSIIGYLYLKGGQIPILNRMIKRFKKENPSIGKGIQKK